MRRFSGIGLVVFCCQLMAEDIEHAGGFVAGAGMSSFGRFEVVDAFVPNSGGLVQGQDGTVSVSLNELFSLLRRDGEVAPIDIGAVKVLYRWLGEGDLYIEFSEERWELVFSEDLEAVNWSVVEAGGIFQPEGKGWRVSEGEIPDSLFFRARLK
ncbi:hypothetical protein VDG1235_933 [Verrucomicrobiia bacterium DG1235]|nr:hypothetical protein VDG1235_933 [Verrucomicrobiae bacterium DG1235]